MNAGKKARYSQSITNNTNIFGIMGGLAPRVGVSDIAVYRHILIKAGNSNSVFNGKTPAQQQTYMKNNNLLSVNPLKSGGVGRRMLLIR